MQTKWIRALGTKEFFMGKISTGFSMSLDGYVAGPDDNVDQVFKWMSSGGDVPMTLSKGDGDIELKVSSASAERLEEASAEMGALVAGRRLFEITNGCGGRHPLNVPIFVVTHRVMPAWVGQDWPVTFVYDGLASAIEQAQRAAGEKTVAVASTTLVQQCLREGLLDEIHIDLAPFVLGAGVRLFDSLDAPIELESTRIVAATGVTHLTFRVLK